MTHPEQMDESLRATIRAIHDCPVMIAMVIAGAGSQALAWLLSVPGASRTLLEAVVPYSSRALVDYLGWCPPQVVSPGTAVSLSAAAYARACTLREGERAVIGVGCTATVATDRPKRGEHRCHIGVWDSQTVTTYSLRLRKGLRDRAGEEAVVSQLVIRAIASSCGLDITVPVDIAAGEAIEVQRESVVHPLARLLDGAVDSLTFYGPGVFAANEPIRAAILSGSFNPLHEGHRQLAHTAEARLCQPVVFELSVRNVDKPPLTVEQIEARLEQFAGERRRVVLSCEPLYRDKARLFPGCTFVMGYDTAARLINPAYYGGDPAAMLAALAGARDMGSRFLVAGRLTEGRFCTLNELPIPTGFEDLFEGIPETDFRLDISSTDLRRREGR